MTSLILLLFLGLPQIPYLKSCLGLVGTIANWNQIQWKQWLYIWSPLILLFWIGGIRANNSQIAFLGHPILGCGILDWLAISLLCSCKQKFEIEKPTKITGILAIALKLAGFKFGHPGEEAIAFFLLGEASNNRIFRGIFWGCAAAYGNRSIFLGTIAWLIFCSKLPRWQKIIGGIGAGIAGGLFTWQRITAGYNWSSDRLKFWHWAIKLIEPLGVGIHNPIYADTAQLGTTASLHNIFLDVAYGGGWLGAIAFLWILWNYRCKFLIPGTIALANWYFCSSNFWIFWLVAKERSHPNNHQCIPKNKYHNYSQIQ